MTDSERFVSLGAAVEDARFCDVDMALRRGRHVDREDADWFAYLLDAQGVLDVFYRRYGCELVYRSDGYFFLLPTADKLPKRQMSVGEMIVGQAAALLYLDPHTIETQGTVTRDHLLSHLATVMGADALIQVFAGPRRRRVDERVAQETVRAKVAEGLRKLAALGFVDLQEGDQVRLRAALMRFAEPVRGTDSPAAALEKLVARGEIALGASDSAEGDESDLDEVGVDAAGPDAAEPDTEFGAEPIANSESRDDTALSDFESPGMGYRELVPATDEAARATVNRTSVAHSSELAAPALAAPAPRPRRVVDAWELDEDLPDDEETDLVEGATFVVRE